MKTPGLTLRSMRLGAAVLVAASAVLWAGNITDSDSVRAAREAKREVEWKVPEIFQALGVQRGSRIADIGAGDGFLTLRLAPAVGVEGKVVAVDIDDRALRELKKRVDENGAKNVEVIRGREADPLLKAGSLDGVVILRAYHEFGSYREMLAAIRAALRPGGRLVIADVAPVGADYDRGRQVALHVMAPALVEKELAQAGFQVVLARPAFTRLHDGEAAWLVAAERPASESASAAPANGKI